MAEVVAYVNYIAPVKGAKEKLAKEDPDVAKNPLIFPDEETLSRAHVFRGLSPEEETKYSSMWAELTAG